MNVKVFFLDEDKKKIQMGDYNRDSYICFSCIMNVPDKCHFVRFFPDIKSSKNEAKQFLEMLFDIFPFMKECIVESIDDIVKENCVTISTNNHHGIVLSTLIGIRYIQDFDRVVTKALEFKEKEMSNIEAFCRAHDIKILKGGDQNDNHTLLPLGGWKAIDHNKWLKNFKKKFDVDNLKNGKIFIDDGKRKIIVHCGILKNFYDVIVGGTSE